jgi:two-component system phosphate regulon sensor histidine kinase PhoR
VDKEERILSMNPAAARWLDKEPDRSQGHSLQEVVRNLALQQFISRASGSEQPQEDDITVFQNGERVLHVRSSPLLDADHNRIGTLVVFDDVTQLRRLENVRRDFVANVSHEIKTPLTAIKGFVETLHQGLVDNPREVERFLGIIKKHVDRLNSIIVDLLSLSRVEQESDGRTLETKPVQVLEIFRAARQICRAKAEEKKIRLEFACPPDLIAELDPTLLEQAVVNLLDNAIKYSESEKTVRVEAKLAGGQLVISVQDHGIGIAQRHLPRLFERFYRVDKARSRNMGGTGLGLAIVKHIAKAHGGGVSVDSRLGGGSTFRITLPSRPVSLSDESSPEFPGNTQPNG